MRRVEEMRAAIVEHRSPTGGGAGDAETEEAEGRFRKDCGGHADGGLDDEGLDDVGEDVADDDAEVGGAEGACGFDELTLFDGHDLGADKTGVANPAGDGESEDEVQEAGAEEGDEGDGEEDSGEREEGVGDVDVEDGIEPTAVEAGDAACEEAECKREAGGG